MATLHARCIQSGPFSLADALAALDAGVLSAEGLLDSCLAMIAARDADLYAFLHVDEVGAAALRAMRPRMQMVFENSYGSLDPRMTAGAIIAEPMLALGIARAEGEHRAGVLLEQVGLSRAMAARYPHEFSGGQRQRIRRAPTRPRKEAWKGPHPPDRRDWRRRSAAVGLPLPSALSPRAPRRGAWRGNVTGRGNKAALDLCTARPDARTSRSRGARCPRHRLSFRFPRRSGSRRLPLSSR